MFTNQLLSTLVVYQDWFCTILRRDYEGNITVVGEESPRECG